MRPIPLVRCVAAACAVLPAGVPAGERSEAPDKPLEFREVIKPVRIASGATIHLLCTGFEETTLTIRGPVTRNVNFARLELREPKQPPHILWGMQSSLIPGQNRFDSVFIAQRDENTLAFAFTEGLMCAYFFDIPLEKDSTRRLVSGPRESQLGGMREPRRVWDQTTVEWAEAKRKARPVENDAALIEIYAMVSEGISLKERQTFDDGAPVSIDDVRWVKDHWEMSVSWGGAVKAVLWRHERSGAWLHKEKPSMIPRPARK